MDSPPSLGEITRNGLAAATHAVVVTEPGYFALRGAEQALEAITVVRDNTNLRLRALGDRREPHAPEASAEHKFRLKELQQAYPELLVRRPSRSGPSSSAPRVPASRSTPTVAPASVGRPPVFDRVRRAVRTAPPAASR